MHSGTSLFRRWICKSSRHQKNKFYAVGFASITFYRRYTQIASVVGHTGVELVYLMLWLLSSSTAGSELYVCSEIFRDISMNALEDYIYKLSKAL
jgi:hypothetical protein